MLYEYLCFLLFLFSNMFCIHKTYIQTKYLQVNYQRNAVYAILGKVSIHEIETMQNLIYLRSAKNCKFGMKKEGASADLK